MRRLATDNAISPAYAHLHEGIDILTAEAPDLTTAPKEAKATDAGHLDLDGTVIRTVRVATPGPNGTVLRWSENTAPRR